MKTHLIKMFVVSLTGIIFISQLSFGQQWNGDEGTDWDIFRYGNVGIGFDREPSLIENLELYSGIKLGYSLGNGIGTVRWNSLTNKFEGRDSTGWNSLTNIWKMNGSNIYYNGGNVGIGTVLPTEKLELNGNIKILSNSADIFKIITDINFAPAVKIGISNYSGYQGYGRLVLSQFVGTDAAERIVLNAFGDSYISPHMGGLAIGKTTVNPEYLVDINGKVRANEVVVNSTGADFVFEEDYNLRILSEVESFIKANKHLPEIPTAKEVEENGVSVGEMQSKLLQKIEELTLYIIEQEKRIKELEERR